MLGVTMATRRRGPDKYPLAMLREIIHSGLAPSKQWVVQNSEGDIPLHMLVFNQLYSTNWRTGRFLSSAAAARDRNAVCAVMPMSMKAI